MNIFCEGQEAHSCGGYFTAALGKLGLKSMIDDLWQETGVDEIGSLRGREE